jgi:hypothetical protein
MSAANNPVNKPHAIAANERKCFFALFIVFISPLLAKCQFLISKNYF